jgi:hypothetical protein
MLYELQINAAEGRDRRFYNDNFWQILESACIFGIGWYLTSNHHYLRGQGENVFCTKIVQVIITAENMPAKL